MNLSEYEISPLARADLAHIWAYIARDDPRAADRLTRRLYKQFSLLGEQPEMAEIREDLPGDIRSFSVGNYVIYYRSDEAKVAIVRVLHGARDVYAIFGEESEG